MNTQLQGTHNDKRFTRAEFHLNSETSLAAGRTSARMLFVVSVPAYFMLFHRPGMDGTVQNTGNQTLRSVILVVTGNRFNLDDIPPNGTAKATVKCTGDSHLEIEFQDDDGQTVRHDASGFFQSGYRGTIRLSIKDGEIEDNKQDIEWHSA